MKIGVVGTSEICEVFIDAVKTSAHDIKIVSVFSRKYETGFEFSQKHQIAKNYIDYDEFLNSVDIVYIATPNSIHYSQVKLALKRSCHVIVEKPLACLVSEVRELFDLAKQNNVLLMEAITTLSNPAFDKLKELVEIDKIRHINFSFAKQTRHYNDYINGKYVTVFDKKMGGGSIYDLGIYLVYPLLNLVGSPNKVNTYSTFSKMDADLTSIQILTYNSFVAVLSSSKESAQFNPSVISLTDKTIEIDNISYPKCITIKDLSGNSIEVFNFEYENRMKFQLNHFMENLHNDNITSDLYTSELAIEVSKVLNSR